MVFAAAAIVDLAFAGALVLWAIFGGFYLRLRAYAPLVALCIGPAMRVKSTIEIEVEHPESLPNTP
jgi:hypothetical protein